MVRFLLGRVVWYWLAVPLVILIGLTAARYMGHYNLSKRVLESAALYLLIFAITLSILRLMMARHLFFIWLALLVGNFLSREIHWDGAEAVVYPVFAALIVWMWRSFHRLMPYVSHSLFLSMSTCTIFSYAVSQLLDKHVLPGSIGKRYFSSPIEEGMEVLGHLFLIAAILCVSRPSITSNEAGEQAT